MNEKKNQGELVVRPPCTFDRLVAKYKADSENRPLKKENLLRLSEKMTRLINWW
jgi:hypothetical protein